MTQNPLQNPPQPPMRSEAGINMNCVDSEGTVKPTWGVLGPQCAVASKIRQGRFQE